MPSRRLRHIDEGTIFYAEECLGPVVCLVDEYRVNHASFNEPPTSFIYIKLTLQFRRVVRG